MRLTKEKQGQSAEMQRAFQKETLTFKELTFKKKLEFIWDYYKWWIIGVVFVAVTLGYMIPSIIESNKEVVLYAAFMNSNIVDAGSTTIMDDFVEYSGIDIEGKKIVLDTNMYIERDRPTAFSNESTQKFFALLSTNTMDVVVLNTENFDFYVKQGTFSDLSTILSPEQMEKYKDLLVYASTENDSTQKPYAINTTGSNVLKKDKAYLLDNYFTIPVNAEKQETAVQFLEYLMSEN